VPAEDVGALAEAMLEQTERAEPEPGQRAAMHGRVEQFFSLRRQAEKVLELYRELLC
jgi:hypothetical protein